MSNHSTPQIAYVETPVVEIDVNSALTQIVSGVVTTVLTGVLNRYVITPIVQKSVEKTVHPRKLELGRNRQVVLVDEDVVDAEVIEAEEDADDAK